jgi:hypothetical protein
MPQPDKRVIPPDAGFVGLPIDANPPDLRKGFAFFNEEIRPRREFHEDVVARFGFLKKRFIN